MRVCQHLLLEAVHDRPPLERQATGIIHLRFLGLTTESWTVALERPVCRVERKAPAVATLQLFVSAAQLDEMLEHGLDRCALRYVGSTELLDHLISLLKTGQRMLDLRFRQQVFHAADAYREAAAHQQEEHSPSTGLPLEVEPEVAVPQLSHKPKPNLAAKRALRPSVVPRQTTRQVVRIKK